MTGTSAHSKQRAGFTQRLSVIILTVPVLFCFAMVKCSDSQAEGPKGSEEQERRALKKRGLIRDSSWTSGILLNWANAPQISTPCPMGSAPSRGNAFEINLILKSRFLATLTPGFRSQAKCQPKHKFLGDASPNPGVLRVTEGCAHSRVASLVVCPYQRFNHYGIQVPRNLTLRQTRSSKKSL